MKVSYPIRAVLIVAAAALVVVFWWGHRDRAVPADSAAPAAAGAPTERPVRQIAGLHFPPSGSAQAAAAASDDYDDNPLAEVLRQVLANDPQLDAFMYFHNRPLLDDASTAQFHKLLSDPEILAGVKHDLLYPEDGTADQAGNIKRLMKIDYLRDALDWKDNPTRPAIVATVSEIVQTDNYPADMTMDMRISLSGNKMELYALLSDVAPDRASAAVLASRGTRLEPMMAYIANSIQVRKQLEAKLANEVPL